jgi:hypothetical protein
MSENTSPQPDGTERARLRVKQKVEFYGHLAVYVASTLFLALLNLLTNPHHLWFVWPMFGWGVAILFHFMGTFVFAEGTGLQRRMLERELRHAPR